jgi:hypothetical protein
MNLSEKLAGTYLRLNGFFLLPHFTVFSRGQHNRVEHNHVDLIGLRPANSRESFGGWDFPVDEDFFSQLSNARGCNDSKQTLIAVGGEVKTNLDRDRPTASDLEYIKRFVGDIAVTPLSFSSRNDHVLLNEGTIEIGLRYAAGWIDQRIQAMIERADIHKIESWTWSDEFLSDWLAMHKLHLLGAARPCAR